MNRASEQTNKQQQSEPIASGLASLLGLESRLKDRLPFRPWRDVGVLEVMCINLCVSFSLMTFNLWQQQLCVELLVSISEAFIHLVTVLWFRHLFGLKLPEFSSRRELNEPCRFNVSPHSCFLLALLHSLGFIDLNLSCWDINRNTFLLLMFNKWKGPRGPDSCCSHGAVSC